MENSVQHIAAVIVAAGRGTRAGGPIPKQYQDLVKQPVLARTVHAFLAHEKIGEIVVVIAESDANLARDVLPDGVKIVHGGESRAASVQAGLMSLSQAVSHVLIHDGARPLVSTALISRVIEALETADAAAPALPVTDALWRAEGGFVTAPHPRDGLWRAQTPQGFSRHGIQAAHDALAQNAADDVEVALAAGIEVVIVPGEEDNLKITHPGDFARAERILREIK